MPDNDFSALQERLSELERSIRAMQTRIDHLEGVSPAARSVAAPPLQATGHPTQPSVDATLIGKSVLIVGGGYVLRAMTELGLLADTAGVVLGLLYALVWIGVADRALRRGRTVVAVFDGGTAAIIAASLIWEATTRFHLITAAAASAMIGVIAIALLSVALRSRSTAFALIASLTASLASIGVALGSADPLPSFIAVTAIGALMLFLSTAPRWPAYVTLILAGAGHSLALTLIVMAIFEKLPYGVALIEGVLAGFGVVWLVTAMTLPKAPWPALAQSIAAVVVGFGGAAIIAAFHGGDPRAVGVLCLLMSGVTFAVVFARRNRDAAASSLLAAASLAAAIGFPLLVTTPALPLVAAAATILFASLGRSLSWPALTIVSACWSIAAFASGLASPAMLVIVCVAAVIAISITTAAAVRSRFVLLVVSTASLIVAAVSFATFAQPLLALNRTAILVVAAVTLSLLNRHVQDAGKIARVLLVICGIKLLVEDLRLGRATTIVAALALYGVAIVIVARRPGEAKRLESSSTPGNG